MKDIFIFPFAFSIDHTLYKGFIIRVFLMEDYN